MPKPEFIEQIGTMPDGKEPTYGTRPLNPESGTWDFCNVEQYMTDEQRDSLHSDLAAIKSRRNAFVVEMSLSDVLPPQTS